MKYLYENREVKSKLILCDALESERGLPEDTTLYRLIWVKAGKIELFVNYERRVLRAGEVVCLSRLDRLRMGKVSGTYRAVLFNERFYPVVEGESLLYDGLFDGAPGNVRFSVPKEDAPKLDHLAKVFLEELAVNDARQDEMLRVVFKRTLILCHRLACRERSFLPNYSARFEAVRRFHVLVNEHFRQTKRVADYAAMLCQSPQTLAGILAHYRQPSARQIIHNRLLDEAERLLYYTSKTAKDIALTLGFDSPASFSRFFKNKTRLSPTAFRRHALLNGRQDAIG